MQICDAMKSLRIAAVPVILILVGITVVVTARAQATSPAAAPVQLQLYTAPDKSASAGVPSGWQVTNAGSGAIAMAGPQGEAVDVRVIVAHDGQFQVGQKGPSGADLTMPSSAKLSDKLVMVLEHKRPSRGARSTVQSTFMRPPSKCHRAWASAACLPSAPRGVLTLAMEWVYSARCRQFRKILQSS